MQNGCPYLNAQMVPTYTLSKNKEERYSWVPCQSGTRYSAKGPKGRWRSASSKSRL